MQAYNITFTFKEKDGCSTFSQNLYALIIAVGSDDFQNVAALICKISLEGKHFAFHFAYTFQASALRGNGSA